MKKKNTTSMNEIKEKFQVSTDDDIHASFFDLSANFYNITSDELSNVPPQKEDEVILDIGGAFGEFDSSRIPWDSENRTMRPGTTLWGVVSQQATAALFNKVNDANQMANMGDLPYNTDINKFTYQSPLFQVSASNEEEKVALEVAEQVTNLAYPILFEALARGELIKTLKSGAKLALAPFKLIDRFLLGGVGKSAAIALGIIKVANKAVDASALKSLENVAKGATALDTKVGTKAESAASKFMKLRDASQAAAKAARGTAAGSVERELAEKLAKESKTAFKALSKKAAAKVVATIMGRLLTKLIVSSAITMVSLSAIPGIGPQLDLMYMVIVMPLLMGLQMSGVIDSAISKLGDPEGCCPPNSIPLDILIPDWAQMIVSNIPVLGDVLSCFFPYMCSVRGTGALIYKTTLTLPKWLEYPWLSCYYLKWPEYNCRIGSSVMLGKTYIPDFEHPDNDNGIRYVNANGSQATGSGYDWDNVGLGHYTKLSDVAENPNGYVQTVRRMINGLIDDTEKERIVPADQKFFYADFSETRMLIDMGRFYYNWAIKNPVPNDDGTVTIEYISKINYVMASTLYTCDAMCEMKSVTFNPITGENYSETITYDRDRRFYYLCDNSVNPPNHWEDSVLNWEDLDDVYDLAVNDLNEFIHQAQFKNTTLKAAVLHTAYVQMLDASNRYVFISNITMNNLSNKIVSLSNTSIPMSSLPNLVRSDPIVQDFYNIYTDTTKYIETILSTNLTNGGNIAVKSQVMNKVIAIHNASNAIYNYRYNNTSSPSYYTNTSLINNQYKIVGCTYVDNTAACAVTPEVLNLEEDSRYRCNFDVIPHLIRCDGVNMSISKCIDASNVELVIYNYLLQYPTKRIKTINSIKAKGTNCCEFIWDEVTMDPVTKTETNLKKDVNTQILYQQDLSSCTFNLPPPIAISGASNYLFGSQTGGTTGLTTTTSLKMFKNPVSNLDYPNYPNNSNLAYKQAKFKFPVFTPGKNLPTAFVESNVNYVPRYNPTTFEPMLDLVRPRKPIRIFYPGEDEKNLGNYSNNYCSDPAMLQRFLLSYNGNSNNIDKITTVVRAYTSSSNTCDVEVDTLESSTNFLKRITMTLNMVEGFQSVASNSHRFNYSSVNPSGGLNIDRNVDPLSNPNQDGIGFNTPYLRSFQTDVVPYTSFFNDDLIKDFTGKTKSLRDNTNRLLVGLTGTKHLGGPSCTTKCQDSEVVQRIIEQYNKDGSASTRFDAQQNSIIQVLNSATNSSNTCHILVQNKNEEYNDFYLPNEIKYSPSNYMTESRLAFKKVEMADAGGCTFYPVPNQIYEDISASDLALSSSANFNTYITPKRKECAPVNCGDPNLYTAAMQDYMDTTGNPITQSNAYIAIGPNKCDYLIKTDITLSDDTMLSDGSGNEDILDMDLALRVSYDAPLYRTSSSSNCRVNYPYTYNLNNVVLQTEADVSDSVENPEYYQFIDSNANITSPLLGTIDDNEIIRSSVHNL